MEITQDNVILKTVPAAAFVFVETANYKSKGIYRWVNLAQMKTVCYMESTNQIHLYPMSGAMIRVTDPNCVDEIRRAIASYTITPA